MSKELEAAAENLRAAVAQLYTGSTVSHEFCDSDKLHMECRLDGLSAAPVIKLHIPRRGDIDLERLAANLSKVRKADSQGENVTELHGAAFPSSAHSELDAILNREVTIAFGQRAADNAVTNETLTLRRLISNRLTPREGPKDGPYLLQGSSVSSQRKNGNMREQQLLIFDVENGDSESEVADRIRSAGFLAAIYTTHSHMKKETRMSERDFASLRQPGRSDVDVAREFLRARKQYRPWLLDTIVRVKRVRVDGGAEYVVVHAPMPRLRVVLFLEKPFPFFVEGKTITERIGEWKARYLAGATALGLVVDQSCADPARLMYLPSHAPGTPKPKTRLIEGRLLDLDALEVSPDDATARATAGAVPPAQFTPVTTGLKKFLARYDKVFDAVAFFAERDEPRHEYDDGRAEFGCPNEHSHTSPNLTDRAFVVQPAKDGRGFNLFCQHNGCQYEPQKCDRAQLLDVECVERGIKHAQELLKWCPGHEADTLEARDSTDASTELHETTSRLAIDAVYMARCIADVPEEAIRWLWPQRFALGKVSLIVGMPKVGKSQITAVMGAAVTKLGVWPDETKAPLGSVIFITAEDDVADTIRPRLEAAGADTRKCHILDWVKEKEDKGVKKLQIDVSRHAPQIADMCRDLGDVRMVIFDPISAYLGRADSHKNADVRQALTPLQTLAAEMGFALILISHFNKNSTERSALNRVAGAGAFVAVARANWLAMRDPNDDTGEQRLFIPFGANIGKGNDGFTYRIEDVLRPGGVETSRVVFDPGTLPIDADAMLEAAASSKHGAGAEAEAFLRQQLAGGPRLVKEVEAAARAADVALATLKRARKKLGVTPFEKSGEWWISLPDNGGGGGQSGSR